MHDQNTEPPTLLEMFDGLEPDLVVVEEIGPVGWRARSKPLDVPAFEAEDISAQVDSFAEAFGMRVAAFPAWPMMSLPAVYVLDRRP